MRRPDVVAVLGEPTETGDNYLRWWGVSVRSTPSLRVVVASGVSILEEGHGHGGEATGS
jgi:hypothetical protein